MDIIEFIENRIFDDEEAARDAAAEVDRSESWEVAAVPFEGICVWPAGADYASGLANPVTDHIERHDPDRVLGQCRQLRKIIGYANEATECDEGLDLDSGLGPRDLSENPYIGDRILQAIAAIWSDHPDFDPGWNDDGAATPVARPDPVRVLQDSVAERLMLEQFRSGRE